MKLPRKPITFDLTLPVATRFALFSDLHLGDGSAGDLFGRKDDLFISTLERELRDADAVVFNGDVCDHMRATPEQIERAHPRVIDCLRRLPERRPVYYVFGNHGKRDQLRRAFGDFHFVDALRVGDALAIVHGQQFDIHWSREGGAHLSNRVHELLERYLQRPIRQPFRDYDNRLNGLVHRLFFRWTQLLRLHGALRRAVGDPAAYRWWQEVDNYWARGQWGDIGAIFEHASQYLLGQSELRTLVLGHSHQPGVVALGEPRGSRHYVNLGSWVLNGAEFGRGCADALQVIDARNGRVITDERYRALFSGLELPDMAGWFRRYYRGWFTYDVEALHRDFPAVELRPPDAPGAKRSPSVEIDSAA